MKVVEYEGKLIELNISYTYSDPKPQPNDYTMGTQYITPPDVSGGLSFTAEADGGKLNFNNPMAVHELKKKKFRITIEVID